MAFEAIQKVTQTEEASRGQKAEAAAQAKRIVADAQRAGKAPPRAGAGKGRGIGGNAHAGTAQSAA